MFILVASRFTPFFIGSSLTPFSNIPMMVRLLIMIVFALVVVSVNNTGVVMEGNIFISMLKEFLLGTLMAFAVVATYSAIVTIGKVVDMQIGFGAAGIVNPSTNSHEPLIGSAYLLAFTTLFFLLGLHSELIGYLVLSVHYIPLGQFAFFSDSSTIITFLSTSFTLGVLLFMPVMLVLWCLDLLIGFVSKTMPQMNVYFVTLPLKIFIGLGVLAATIKHSGGIFTQLFSHISHYYSMFVG